MNMLTIPKQISIFVKGQREVEIARLGSQLVELRKARQTKSSKLINNKIVDVLAKLALLNAEVDVDGFIRTL